MKIPAPMMPPITAMVVPKRPRCRARPLEAERSLEFSGAVTIRGSTRLRQFVEVFDVRERGAVHALHFGVFRFNDVILIGRMRAIAVAEAKMTGRQAEWIAGEDIAGPGTGEARKNHWVDAILFVHRSSRA